MTLHGAVLARDALPQLGRVFGSGTPTRPWNDGLQLLRYTRGVSLPPILLGTSSFTASGWAGSFYPKGMPPADYLNISLPLRWTQRSMRAPLFKPLAIGPPELQKALPSR